jgi:hypothetical protein
MTTHRASLTKTAVDAAAEEYWQAYFGDYGKQWVRKIPRRVAQAMAQRTAAKGDDRMTKAQIGGLGWAETPTGGLHFEGVFRGTMVKAGRATQVLSAFAAEFDANGKLIDLQASA